MMLEQIKNYFKDAITDGWYKNASIDYGITGEFIDAEIIGNHLKIVWSEMGEKFEMIINWFNEYSLEQLYNIWMEMS